MASSAAHHDARIAQMTLVSVYPHYVTKVVKKGRTEAELRTVILWLTGLEDAAIDAHLEAKTTFEISLQRLHCTPMHRKLKA